MRRRCHVSILAPFAADKHAVTFDEWDACVVAEAATSSSHKRSRQAR
jgi:hypothetical protein